MNYDGLFAHTGGRIVTGGLVGAGQFGASLVLQAAQMRAFDISIVCDLDLDLARNAYLQAGFAADNIVAVDSVKAARQALGTGKKLITDDYRLVNETSVDIVIEATGQPEAAARVARDALTAGHHVAMVTKEADSVVGPYLSYLAEKAGKLVTPVDGDQPSLLIKLVSWARLLGLEILCAGKSSEYDFIWCPDNQTVSWRQITKEMPEFAPLWAMGARRTNCLAAREHCLNSLPQRTVPDLCEMGIVCNHTGLMPDNAEFHAPHARVSEVSDLLCPTDRGGILSGPGRVDVFNCLRRPDEQSFAGGVFVVVDCVGSDSWQVLKEKGIPVSRNGRQALIYNPAHLLGIEAPVSLLSTVLLEQPSGRRNLPHLVDLHGCATRDWKRGEVLAVTDLHHHEVAGLKPKLAPAQPAQPDNALPYYMAAGNRLACDVAKGQVITRNMVAPPAGSVLWEMRDEMDKIGLIPG